MPFVWNEVRDGRSVLVDTKGDQKTRAWYIPGASPDPARVDTNPARPERGDEHPDFPGLVANSISYAHYLAGTRCEATYIPAELLQDEQENDTDIDFFDGDGHTVHIKREIPVIEYVKQSMTDSSSPDQYIWRPVDPKLIAPFEYTAIEFSTEIIAQITSTPHLDQMLLILDRLREEDGKIHRINGVDYSFGTEGTERVSKDKYRLVYTWRSDPGLPNTLAYNTQISPNWAWIGGYGYGFYDNEFIIPPFSRIDTGPALTGGVPDPTIPPVLVASPTKIRNDDGWQTLPGIQF